MQVQVDPSATILLPALTALLDPLMDHQARTALLTDHPAALLMDHQALTVPPMAHRAHTVHPMAHQVLTVPLMDHPVALLMDHQALKVHLSYGVDHQTQ